MKATSPETQLIIRWAVVTVPSFSDPSKSYVVTLDPRDGLAVDCDCPDHTHRRRRCRHMGEADAGRCSKPHIRAMAIPPSAITVHNATAFERYVEAAQQMTASVADMWA